MRRVLELLVPGLVMSLTSCTDVVTIPLDPNVQDYTAAVRQVLAGHPKGRLELRFDEGVYDFYGDEAVKEYLAVSNNDNGIKPVVFFIRAMKDVRISGNNTEFLFHGGIVPFYIEASAGVSVEGIHIDYDHPFLIEGTVLENCPEERSATLEINTDCLYEVRDGRLILKGYDWECGLGDNIVFNPETRSPYFSTEIYDTSVSGMSAVELAPGIVRLTGFTGKEVPPVGSVYVDKGSSPNRLYPGIAVQGCRDISITDVDIYCSGAMALIAERTKNIVCRNFNVKVRDGSSRMISASADATHFVGCSGDIVLEDCHFESMLDDATNVHGVYMIVDKVLDNNTFKATFGHSQQVGHVFANVGDELDFIDRDGLVPIGRGRISSFTKEGEACYVISTDFPLSGYEGRDMAVGNANDRANVLIRNCVVRYNRARSLLLSTKGNVLVEGCFFASMMAGIRICGDANFWFESGPTDNIVIRNNEFVDLANGGWSPQAVLQIDPVIHRSARNANAPFHKSITFEDNVVRSFEDQLIYALSVDSLVIRGNSFMNSASYPVRYAGLPVIDVQNCNKVFIQHNDFSNWKEDAVISVHESVELECDSSLPLEDRPNPFYYSN